MTRNPNSKRYPTNKTREDVKRLRAAIYEIQHMTMQSFKDYLAILNIYCSRGFYWRTLDEMCDGKICYAGSVKRTEGFHTAVAEELL